MSEIAVVGVTFLAPMASTTTAAVTVKHTSQHQRHSHVYMMWLTEKPPLLVKSTRNKNNAHKTAEN